MDAFLYLARVLIRTSAGPWVCHVEDPAALPVWRGDLHVLEHFPHRVVLRVSGHEIDLMFGQEVCEFVPGCDDGVISGKAPHGKNMACFGVIHPSELDLEYKHQQ